MEQTTFNLDNIYDLCSDDTIIENMNSEKEIDGIGMLGFTIRTTKPSVGNKCYIRIENGGWSSCIKGNPTDSNCNVLSNCVGYAIGRASEIYNEIKGTEGNYFNKLNSNAENFIERAKEMGLEIGSTPKEGAIICWSKGKSGVSSDGAGHVAVVEKVNSNGNIYTSESAYNGSAFYNATRTNSNGRWGIGNAYTFRAFIYNPACEIKITPVERDKTQNQIKVLKYLNIRKSPSINGIILSQANIGDIFNDLETKESDGYTWHKIEENMWIAQNKDNTYLELLPKYNYEDLIERIEKLELQNKDLNNIIELLNKKISDIKLILNN